MVLHMVHRKAADMVLVGTAQGCRSRIVAEVVILHSLVIADRLDRHRSVLVLGSPVVDRLVLSTSSVSAM